MHRDTQVCGLEAVVHLYQALLFEFICLYITHSYVCGVNIYIFCTIKNKIIIL